MTVHERDDKGGISSNDAPGVLALRDIVFRWTDRAWWRLYVDRLELAPGAIYAVVGPNGSGKSTLLRIASGLLPPNSGTVSVQGVPLSELDRPSIARRIGYLPQQISPQFDLMVDDVVRLGRYVHLRGIGGLRSSDREAVRRAMEKTGVASLAERRLSELSGGEARRVFLASVLAQEPQVFLLDEPGAGLDLHQKVAIFGHLRALAADGAAVMAVTHDLNIAALFADRLILICDGRIAAYGPPDKVLIEELLHRVYGPELCVVGHPDGKTPVVLPRVVQP